MPLLAVAIGGLLAMPAVASVIAGATKPEQVRANVAAGEWEPSADELAALKAGYPARGVRPQARAGAGAAAPPADRTRAPRARAGYASTSSSDGASGRCAARAATVSPTAAPTQVTTRRHWYCTGYTLLRVQRHPDEQHDVRRPRVEIAAPTIPYAGTSQKLSPTFTAAPIPVTTQFSCVLRARPLPIASTT